MVLMSERRGHAGTRFQRKEERKKKYPPLLSYPSKPIIAPTGEPVQKAREIPGEVCSNQAPGKEQEDGWGQGSNV